jgi:hypothetical protein
MLPKTCQKCGQRPVAVETCEDGFAIAMLSTGHLVCGSCFVPAQARIDAPPETVKPPAPSGKHDQPRMFNAPQTIRGQMTLG